MRIYFVVLFLPLLAFGTEARSVPKYVVDLDQDAFYRWRQVASVYGPIVQKIGNHILNKILTPKQRPLVRVIANALDTYLEEPYQSEIAGFSTFGNVSLDVLITIQLFYDATAFCTSIVCVDNQQRVWHARNLDYSTSFIHDLTNDLKQITIDVRFVRNNQTLIHAVTWAGFLGLLTGERLNGFSITLNQRSSGSLLKNLISALKMVLTTGRLQSVSFFLRDVLNADTNFSMALHHLSTTPLIAPCYLIIGGMSGDEGAVVTRSREGAIDVYRLDRSMGRWFVLETNYDRWEQPPPYDDRRTAGRKAMQKMSRSGISSSSLFSVLFTPPVLNKGTVFSTVMSASQSRLLVTIP